MENKKLTKEKKIFIILLIILFFLIVIIGITIAVGTVAQENNKEKENANTKKEATTNISLITCINEEMPDDITKSEQVYMEEGKLITRTDKSSWNKTEPREDTCKYYQTQTVKLNELYGVTSQVTCDESRGTATTIYTISEIDRTKTKLKQFDYLNEENIFDYKSWMTYMESKEYTCKIGE